MALRLTAASSEHVAITASTVNHNGNYTIACWYRAVSLTNGTIFAFQTDNHYTNGDFLFTDSSGFLEPQAFLAGASTDPGPGTGLTAGVWNHLALVRESATVLRSLVNGVSDGVATKDITGRGATGAMYLGTFLDGAFSTYADARYAGLKAWSRALSAAEIRAEMRSMRPVSTVSLYDYWPFLSGNATMRSRGWAHNHNWTEVNTPSDEASPPVRFGLQRHIVGVPTATAATGQPAVKRYAGIPHAARGPNSPVSLRGIW